MSRVCNHENILPFVGVMVRPQPAVVTKFMMNGNVEDLLVRESPRNARARVPYRQLVLMAQQAATGVVHLHREGVIHRDLAARNLLVDEGFRVRVSDFGFARLKAAHQSRGQTAAGLGPIKWMAPEALRMGTYSEASDVFAFGVVLFELFASEAPWGDAENLDVVVRVCGGERLLPPPWVDPHVARVMEACWDASPKERPAMAALAAWLGLYAAALGPQADDPLGSVTREFKRQRERWRARSVGGLDAGRSLVVDDAWARLAADVARSAGWPAADRALPSVFEAEAVVPLAVAPRHPVLAGKGEGGGRGDGGEEIESLYAHPAQDAGAAAPARAAAYDEFAGAGRDGAK
jgi:serine/threonine-protein kinase CTR1